MPQFVAKFEAPIDTRRLEDLIRRKGQNVEWIRTARCPCLTDSGRTKYQCAVCGGSGWARVSSKLIRAALTAHKKQMKLTEAGELETGTAQLTPPRWVRLAEGDFIVRRQFPLRGSEVIEHQASPHWIGDPINQLFPHVIEAVHVIRDNALATLPVTSYTLDAAKGTIVWDDAAPDADKPKPGENYTVELTYHEAYQVWRGDKPMARGTEDKRLNDRANLRLVTRRILREPS